MTSTTRLNEPSVICKYEKSAYKSTTTVVLKFIEQHFIIAADDHEFVVPTKVVKTPADMVLWHKSEAYFVCDVDTEIFFTKSLIQS